MAKNDFDIDFDFEKEFGFDPNGDLNAEFDAADLDLSDFDVNGFGFDLEEENGEAADYSDFDVASLNLEEAPQENGFDYGREEFADFDADFGMEQIPDMAAAEEYPLNEDFGSEEYAVDEDFDAEFPAGMFPDGSFGEEDLADNDFDVMPFPRRASFFEQPQQYGENAYYGQGAYDQTQENYAEDSYADSADVPYTAPINADYIPDEIPYTAPLGEAGEGEYIPQEFHEEKPDLKEVSHRRRKERQERTENAQGGETKPPREPINLTVPPILIKFWNLYFPSKEMLNAEPNPNSTRRRRKKTKVQIFKEAYLPAILLCLTFVLVLTFVIGSIGNAIKLKKIEDNAARESSISAANQAELVKSEAEMLLAQAEVMAQGYDYDGAIMLLDSFSGNIADYEEMVAAKSKYVSMRDSLIEFNNPATIPNLSFHVLIHDPARAYADKDLGGLYNRNFVTTEEFQRILEQLYNNNFVLVDYDSFVSSNTDLEGNANFFPVPIRLPDGKKPVMITETMVNYYDYMIDGNKDGTPDAGGDGFAARLVVDANGDIKAEYVDINSETHVGNYDLVPILEDFIKQHPDFSYQGARATLAVTGEQGVFGYRTNTSYIASVGNEYYEKEVIAAKEVVQALRNKGYRIACYTYKNENYNQLNANLIQADLTKWNEQITPVLGPVDTIVFAKESDIGDYSGPKFNVLYTSGFRIMVTDSDTPYAEVNNTYVRQSRLMVTGNTMAWKSAQFTNLGLFDPNVVLDMANRKQVPN